MNVSLGSVSHSRKLSEPEEEVIWTTHSANPPAAQVGVFLWIGALHLWDLTAEGVKIALIVW